MTSPVPDALRTQLAEVLRQSCGYGPAMQRLVLDALLPTVANALARARVEGAAEALREAATYDDAQPIRWPGSSGEWLRRRAAALSASTTTEGDPT